MRQTQTLLNTAFKTGDRATICSAINAMILATDDVSAFARRAGVYRTSLYRTFKRNPGLDLVFKVLRAADFKIIVVDYPKTHGKPSAVSKNLSSAFDSEEIALITKALSKTLRDQENVRVFAEKANMHRVTLYRAFTVPRVPTLNTVLCFLNALDLRLSVYQRSH